jgi:hypothetical protein
MNAGIVLLIMTICGSLHSACLLSIALLELELTSSSASRRQDLAFAHRCTRPISSQHLLEAMVAILITHLAGTALPMTTTHQAL